MSYPSLHQGVFRLVVGLVVATSLTILINVWWATYEQAKQRMSKDLNLAQTVLAQVLDSREELLFTSASVLADDFGFKQAVATKDAPTIASALNNHSNRIGADIMAIYTLAGGVITSTENAKLTSGKHSQLKSGHIEQVLANGGNSGFMLINGKLYKTILLRIDAPTPLALSLVGFEINQNLLNELEKTVQLDVQIEASSAEQDITIVSQNQIIDAIAQASQSLQIQHLIFSHNAVIEQAFGVYKDADLDIQVKLTQTVDALISEFAALKTNISIIIIIAAIFAFIVANLYAKKLTKPLRYLSQVTKTISSGDYQQIINTNNSSKEFADLAHAFKNMQNNIRERETEIIYQAEHDPLTGLFTRHHAEYLIDHKLAKRECFQVVAFNIVGFRAINDVFGYQDGDLCLSTLANRISKLGGLAAKFTGGEFLWIPASILSHAEIADVQSNLEQPINENKLSIPIKLACVSILCPQQAENAELVFKRLNISLDEAQLSPTRLLAFEEKFEDKYVRRLKIITQLKMALASNSDDLSLNYQAKLHLSSQQVNSVEALIRWTDAGLGFVPPDEFINLAEQAGIIEQVTFWVIKRAIEDAQKMRDANLNICIAINLSAQDIANPQLLAHIKDLLHKAGLPQSSLSFEITESDLVQDPKTANQLLQEFQNQGHQLAIDDFGTGYSSLAYLKSFPVNTLKIDKSFILDLSTNKDDQDIVETIMQLAEKFGLSVVAEGVEDKQSLQILTQLGCTWAQGFYMCKPIALPAFIKWCEQHKQTNWLEA